MENKQLQIKYCDTLDCEVVIQNENGVNTCLSSHLCKSNGCEDRQHPAKTPSTIG